MKNLGIFGQMSCKIRQFCYFRTNIMWNSGIFHTCIFEQKCLPPKVDASPTPMTDKLAERKNVTAVIVDLHAVYKPFCGMLSWYRGVETHRRHRLTSDTNSSQSRSLVAPTSFCRAISPALCCSSPASDFCWFRKNQTLRFNFMYLFIY